MNSQTTAWISGDDSKRPLVSVIIPAYNARTYVMDAINSVRTQDYSPMEILLIDDGSQDGTADLVHAAAPEVRIISQENAGVASARNTGLREAMGEYLCFLDADDGWFQGKLKAQADYLFEHPEVGLVYHRWLVWKPDQDGVYRMPAISSTHQDAGQIDSTRSGWIYPQLLLDCIVHTSTVMIRREITKKVGDFDTKLISGQDYDYWLRVSRLTEIHQLVNVYSFYRTVLGSLSTRMKKVNYEYLIVQRALHAWGAVSPDGRNLDKRTLAKRLAKISMDFGSAHFHYGSADIAWHSFLRVLKHDPLCWRAMLYLLAARVKAISLHTSL